MRINKFVALATGLSRREADRVINEGLVTINSQTASTGQIISSLDIIKLRGEVINQQPILSIMLNKPPGYVCSRKGQGNQTIYSLLPNELQHLKTIGRLDKESSGLLLLTNNGNLAHQLTHPSFNKQKIYQIELNKPLKTADRSAIEQGIMLEDGISALALSGTNSSWQVTMSEGRNRQIRRTFNALNYTVTSLHRTKFGQYQLGNLAMGKYRPIK